MDLPHGVRLGVLADPALGSMLLMHTIMNCAGRATAQAWSDAHAGAPEADHTNATLRESCVQLCATALQREWEWVSLGSKPQRRQRYFPVASSNFSMPEVTYADALRRPTPTHPKGDSTKMDRDKTQQPAQPTERPIDILPCDRPSDVQLRQQADTILAMEKNLQLLQERVASLETKFDEVLAILRRQDQLAVRPSVAQQREETAIVQKPASATDSWFSARRCLTAKSKRAVGRVPAAAAEAGGGPATPSTAVVVADLLPGSPVTPPAKRQSQETPKPP